MRAMGPRVRLARESDLGMLRRCARTLHRDTRFYFDQKFERAKCDLLYETWIENSCLNPSQTVFVPEVEGQPVGYLACHADGQEAQIGLLGVSDHTTVRVLGRRWCGDSSRGPRSNRLTRHRRHPGTQYRRSGTLSILRIPSLFLSALVSLLVHEQIGSYRHETIDAFGSRKYFAWRIRPVSVPTTGSGRRPPFLVSGAQSSDFQDQQETGL